MQVNFPKLESLELDSLKLQRIWNHQLSSSCDFQSLKRLTVVGCNNLYGLIPSSMIGNLQSIFVASCEAMKEVVYFTENLGGEEKKMEMITEKGKKMEMITEEGKRMEMITLPKLESLVLRDLPNLERFSASDCYDFSSSLKSKPIGCPKLKTRNIELSDSMDSKKEDLVGLPQVISFVYDCILFLFFVWFYPQ